MCRSFLPLLFAFPLMMLFSGCAELEQLRAVNAMQERRIAELQNELRSRTDTYYQESTQSQGTIGQLQQRLNRTEKDLERALNQRSERERDLQQRLEEAQSQLGLTRTELERSTRTVSELREELNTSSEQASQRAAELDKVSRQAAANESEKKALASETAKLKEELASLKERNGSLEKQLDQEKSRSEGLEKKAGQLQDKADRLETAAEKSDGLATAALEKEVSELKERIRELQAGQNAAAGDLKAAGKLLETSLKPLVEAGFATIDQEPRGMVISLTAEYLFERGLVDLDPAVSPTLNQIGEVLNRYPALYVEVMGHTDRQSVVNMPFADNWALGAARADRVAHYLTDRAQVAPARLKASTASKFRPTGKGERFDRRVEIVLSDRP